MNRNNKVRQGIQTILRVEVLPTKSFKSKFLMSVGRCPVEMILISPYMGAIPGYSSSIDFARFVLSRDATRLMIVTRPPSSEKETLSVQEAEILERMGVDLRVRTQPPLHSKVYFFLFQEGDYSAFVGSANFTIGGFKRNDESVAFFRDVGHRTVIDKEVRRLTTFGAFPFSQWKIWSVAARKGDQRT